MASEQPSILGPSCRGYNSAWSRPRNDLNSYNTWRQKKTHDFIQSDHPNMFLWSDSADCQLWRMRFWTRLELHVFKKCMCTSDLSQIDHQILIYPTSALLVKHPHGICPLVNLVHFASSADWKWSILSVLYYRSWMKCSALARTSQNGWFFHQIHVFVTMDWTSAWYLPPCQSYSLCISSWMEVINSRCSLL